MTHLRNSLKYFVSVNLAILTLLPFLVSCQTAEEAFVQDRLHAVCDEAYWQCGLPTGCVLDSNHYADGAFPGVRRVVIVTEDNDMDVQVRIFIGDAQGGGTEMLVQLYEADCTLDRELGKEQLVDVDLIKEAGDDRVLIFNLHVMQEGEHVLELYSDMTAEFLLIAE